MKVKVDLYQIYGADYAVAEIFDLVVGWLLAGFVVAKILPSAQTAA